MYNTDRARVGKTAHTTSHQEITICVTETKPLQTHPRTPSPRPLLDPTEGKQGKVQRRGEQVIEGRLDVHSKRVHAGPIGFSLAGDAQAVSSSSEVKIVAQY